MRSLFVKIFLCFWLSHTLAVVLVYAIMSAREAQRPEMPRRGRFSVPPSRTITLHAHNAAAIYEGGIATLDSTGTRTNTPGTTATGATATGTTATRTTRAVSTQQAPNRSALETYFKHIESKKGIRAALFNADNQNILQRTVAPEATTLAKRAALSGEMEFMPTRSGLLAARRVQAP